MLADADVKDVFLRALDVPDRAAFLDEACAGDAALRRRLDELLRAHDATDAVLDAPAVSLFDASGEQALTQTIGDAPPGHDDEVRAALALLSPGTRPDSLGRLGHYEVLEVLGRGGFGVVLKALDVTLHRVVAIKLLSPRLAADDVARKRFLREARAAACVRHDHVVTIHAIDEQPVPFLVMECILGKTLQQRLAEGPLGVEEVLRIGWQTAEGLAAAHAQGLVHRDVKPANILLENGIERVKLTDFGLARAVDDAEVSAVGVVIGTPLYMSPEQANGAAVDHRADLFSLGSVLYAACAGVPAFRAETPLAVLKRVLDDDPVPVARLNPAVPPWLAQLIARLHAKRPGDRVESAAEVAALLRDGHARLRRDEAPPAPRRRKRALWAVAVAVLLLACAAGAAWLTWPPAERVADEKPHVEPEPEEEVKPNPAPPTHVEARRFTYAPNLLHVAFDRDGKKLLVATKSGWFIADAQTGRETSRADADKGTNCLPSLVGGDRFVVGKLNRRVTLWDADTGELRDQSPTHQRQLIAVGGTPDGRYLLGLYANVGVRVWDRETRTYLRTFTGGRPGCVSPDGRHVLIREESDRALILWEVLSGKEAMRYELPDLFQTLLPLRPRFSRDGGRLVALTQQERLCVFDVKGGQLVRQWHLPRVTALALSNDGRFAFVGLASGAIEARDVATGELVLRYSGHGDKVNGLGLSPDGKWLVSSSPDATIRTWPAVAEALKQGEAKR